MSNNIHALLKDETRRKIITMLGVNGKVGFKEFHASLGIGVGTLYYHLDVLSDYVTQDNNRKYLLNEKGQLLYKALTDGTLPIGLGLNDTYQKGRLRWLFLTPVFNNVKTSAKWVILSVLILFIGAAGAGLAGLAPILLFYTPTTSNLMMVAAVFLLGWIGVFFLVDLLSRILFKRACDELYLLICLSLALVPLALYPYLYMTLTAILPPLLVTNILRIILLVFQVWSLILLTSAFSYGIGLRLEKAVILSLSLVYVDLAWIVLSGNLPML